MEMGWSKPLGGDNRALPELDAPDDDPDVAPDDAADDAFAD
jgi:hypothetical protein